MSDQYVGEVRMFGGTYAPRGWALCDGRLLSIAQNAPLFSLLGTIYGGDGQTTFALPDLRGRVPMHQGQGLGLSDRTIGEVAGVENVSLTTLEMPIHNHPAMASTAAGSSTTPSGSVPASPSGNNAKLYAIPGTNSIDVSPMAAAIQPDGNNLPHSNMMPALCVNFIIALDGIFPSRN